jgi:hydroxyacylglutathione hydrolase
MLLRRLYDDMLSQASYVIACDETRHAIVVDPNRDIEPYLALAKAEKLTITHVTETHIHADYVSGARALAEAAKAQLLLSGEGGPDWLYRYADAAKARIVRNGDTIEVGTVMLGVMHTPGHTPEHISFLVTDTPTTPTAMGMLSGDFIFVGDVGRPDLLEKAAGIGNTMEALARQLYQSVQKAKELPPHLTIWPGHGAGSPCGKALGDIPSTTLGYERLVNWAFRSLSEQAFVAEVLAGQPEPPKHFARMKQVNRDGPTPRIDPASIKRMSPADVMKAMDDGATVVDVRATAEFALGHMAGTVNIPTGTSFTNWLGSLVDPSQKLIFVIGKDESRLTRALRGASLIGMDNVIGWGGPDVIEEWKSAGKPMMTTEQLGPEKAKASGRLIVDVRGRAEVDEESIPGARHADHGDIIAQMAGVPKDQPLVLHCGSGSRSAIGASVLQAAGFTDVANLKGGIDGWREAGLPVSRATGPG